MYYIYIVVEEPVNKAIEDKEKKEEENVEKDEEKTANQILKEKEDADVNNIHIRPSES